MQTHNKIESVVIEQNWTRLGREQEEHPAAPGVYSNQTGAGEGGE